MFSDEESDEEMAKLEIKDVKAGTMVLDKHNKNLAAPMHPSQANMGDVILIARGKSPKQNLLYCVYENYPHQLYEITSIDQNTRNQVIQNGIQFFNKSSEVFAKMSKDKFEALSKNILERCSIQLNLPKSQPNKQMPTLPKYDFIYKSTQTNQIFKGALTSNRLAVLEPATVAEDKEYRPYLKTSKYACLNQQNKMFVDSLLKNGYNRSMIGGKEYIVSPQLFSEIQGKQISDIVDYELKQSKLNKQKGV